MLRLRKWVWRFVRRVLFHVDPEKVHVLSLRLIRVAIRCGNLPLRVLSGVDAMPVLTSEATSQVKVFNVDFSSRLGLAAGFDKNAEILAALPALGFGFAEIGTVTPRPQPGNDRPRLFRDTQTRSLFNRMGFNGVGAALVAQNLNEARPKLPTHFRVGVNVGKNKDTPLEKSYEDYRKAVQPFQGLADYLVINVSSPNTPGLRSLQSVEQLRPILSEVCEEISKWKYQPPLLPLPFQYHPWQCRYLPQRATAHR